ASGVGRDPGPEVSALYGINETAGEFDIAIDSSGAMTITNVNASLASLTGTSSKSGSTVTVNFVVTNSSWSTLGRARLMLGGLPSGVTFSGNDAHNFYSLGDIGLYGFATAIVTLNNVTGAMAFKVFVTQQKEDRPSAVLEAGGAGASVPSASLFTFKNNMKTAVSGSKALTGTVSVDGGASISLKIDAYGNPKASYLQVVTYDLKYTYWDGSAYQTVTVDSTGKTGYYSSLGLTSLGNPRIAYYSAEDATGAPTGDLKYAYCNSNCGTASNWGTVALDTSGDVGGHTSIAVDNTDTSNPKPRIAYYDFTNQDLKFAWCDANCNLASNWTIVTVDSTGYIGQYASLALNPSDMMPRISYYDYTNGDLKYAYCGAGYTSAGCGLAANWTKQTIDNSSSTDVGGYTSLTYNPVTNRPAVSYYDFANKDLMYAYYGDYSTSSVNLGAATQAFATTFGEPEVVRYTNTTGQTRYRMYYNTQWSGGWYALAYRTTTDANPPAADMSNMDAETRISGLCEGWDRWPGKVSVALLSNGSYRLYYGYRNGSGQWFVFWTDTTTTNSQPPANGTVSMNCTDSSTVKYMSKLNANNPEVVQFINTSGQTRYRMYYNANTNDSSTVSIAYRETLDANPPYCQGWTPTGTSTSVCNNGENTVSYWGNIGPEVSLNVLTKAEYGGIELLRLPDGKYRMYYAQSDGNMVYRDTTDTQPPGTSNFGATNALNVYGTQPSLVQTASGYRLFYSSAGYGYWAVYSNDTTDANPPTASSTTSCCQWNIMRIDSAYFSCGNSCLLNASLNFFFDRGAFSSLAFSVLGRPSISYYSRAAATGEAQECPIGSYGDCAPPNSVGDLMLAQCIADDCTDMNNWTIQAPDTTNDTGWFSSAATAVTGRIFTAYYDATLQDLKIYSLATNLGPAKTLAIGTSAANSAYAQEIIRQDDLTYRLYYSLYNGSYGRVAYRTTTDTNPPEVNGTNLGAETFLPLNSSPITAEAPEVIRLSDNKYRIYYTYNDTASGYWRLMYEDTSDTNPPNSTNIRTGSGFKQPLTIGTSSSNTVDGPDIIRLDNSKYRIYYTKWNGANTNVYYRETTDTNPPASNASNFGAEVALTLDTNVRSPDIIRLTSNVYRIYYACTCGNAWYSLYYKDTTNTSPPESTNLGARQSLNTGTATNLAAYSVKVFQKPDGTYRVYYGWYTTYVQLAYKDATGVNPPDSGNIAAGAGTTLWASTDQTNTPDVVQVGGQYRLYYQYAPSAGAYYQIAYNDTNNGNAPGTTNLGARQLLGVGSGIGTDEAKSPVVMQTATGRYRVYFGFYTTAVGYTDIDLRETYDTNPPNSTNLLPLYLNAGPTQSEWSIKILRKPDNNYRLYYSYWDGSYEQLAFKDATDSNPPNNTNIASGVGTQLWNSGPNQSAHPDITQLANGKFRLYYQYNNGTYWQLAHKDTTDTNAPGTTNLGSAQYMDIGSSATDQALAPDVIRLDNLRYRLYYNLNNGSYDTLYYRETTDMDPPTAY
ncbi:MAG: hypothetical protein HY886_00445, partial [Deltaproteobacteria bacterium]|nr:hypothetical protein [Deltaproteobacteria bacterium]